MNTIYSNYYVTETGPPVEVTPTKAESYLPHSYYISLVISELSNSKMNPIVLNIDELMDRLHHLIEYIHEDEETKATVSSYFDDKGKVMQVLTSMFHSGLLKFNDTQIFLTLSQLDYIRDYLLDYY